MKGVILSHVEQVEYMKERARQLAAEMASKLDPREAVSDPAAFVERLLIALLAVLGPDAVALARDAAEYAAQLGLPTLSADRVKEVTAEAERRFYASAAPALKDVVLQIAARVGDIAAAGVALPIAAAALGTIATQAALLAPLTGVAKRLSASYMQFVERDVNDAAANDLLERSATDRKFAETRTFTWIAVMDRNTCDSEAKDAFNHACAPRHGHMADIGTWRAYGLPGSPVLICSMHAPRGASPCRCIVADSEVVGGLGPIDASEAVKRGRDRARPAR